MSDVRFNKKLNKTVFASFASNVIVTTTTITTGSFTAQQTPDTRYYGQPLQFANKFHSQEIEL